MVTTLRSSPSGRLFTPGTVGPLVSNVGLDGSASVTQTLLEAGHEPGMYLVYRYVLKRIAGTAGNLNIGCTFRDPLAGAIAFTVSAIAVSGTVPTVVNVGVVPCYSDGQSPILIPITFTGITGSPALDVRSWVVQQQ